MAKKANKDPFFNLSVKFEFGSAERQRFYIKLTQLLENGVSLDVGFYYMANAMGRLLGTVLSGWVFQTWGLTACLAISALLILLAAVVSLALPTASRAPRQPDGAT